MISKPNNKNFIFIKTDRRKRVKVRIVQSYLSFFRGGGGGRLGLEISLLDNLFL